MILNTLFVFVVMVRAMFVVMVMPLVRAVVTLMAMVMWLIMVLASWFEVSGLVLEAPGCDLEIPGLDPGALAPASGAPGPRPDPLRSHSEAYHEWVPS